MRAFAERPEGVQFRRVSGVLDHPPLTDFGPVAVVTHNFFEKLHDVARHLHHPLQTNVM
jgi:hypothetical protein